MRYQSKLAEFRDEPRNLRVTITYDVDEAWPYIMRRSQLRPRENDVTAATAFADDPRPQVKEMVVHYVTLRLAINAALDVVGEP